MLQGTIREARLRPEFASLYPSLQPGVWLPARSRALLQPGTIGAWSLV